MKRVLQLLRKPLLFPALALIGFILLFPNVERPEITFRQVLPAGCDAELMIEVRSEQGQLIRSVKHRPLGGARVLEHKVRLSKGKYLLLHGGACEDSLRPQPLIVDRPGTVRLDLGQRCPCPSTAVVR